MVTDVGLFDVLKPKRELIPAFKIAGSLGL